MTEEVIENSGVNAVEAAAPVEQSHEPAQEAQQETAVPLSALQAERRERQRLQEEMAYLKASVEQMSRPKEPESTMTDDDVLTYGEYKKSISQLHNQYKMSIEELKMTQQYPDYQEMIKNYLPEILNEKPYLKATLASDPNKFQLAYDLAKTAPSYLASKKEVKKTKEAERILQNQSQPGSLSSIGHASATKSPSFYKTMSDSDFKALVAKNMGYA
jgi:hypothetical protein